MENQVKKQIGERIVEHLKRGEGYTPRYNPYSLGKLAKQVGVSKTTLSNMKNESWSGISSEIWSKVQTYFGVDGWALGSTKNFVKIKNACEDAQGNSRLIAIAGITGGGKTSALEHYTKNHQNVFYLHCNSTMTQKGFLKAMLVKMGFTPLGSREVMRDRIIEALQLLEHPLFVFDDFTKVGKEIYAIIQQLYDELTVKNSCGIIISGVEKLRDIVFSAAMQNRLFFPEFQNRISAWKRLETPIREEVKGLLKINAPFIETKEEIDYIYSVVKDREFRTLRTLVQNYTIALPIGLEKGMTRIEILASLRTNHDWV